MIGSTIISDGVKLDNLIMIGHNCEIGEIQHLHLRQEFQVLQKLEEIAELADR